MKKKSIVITNIPLIGMSFILKIIDKEEIPIIVGIV